MIRLAQPFLLTVLSLLCLPFHQLEVRAQSVEETIENTALRLTLKDNESSNRLDSSAALAPKQFARSEARDTSGVPIEVMVLGTFHFHKVPDSTTILALERQAQIRAVIRALADFRPTKVALEEVPEDAVRLDSLYQAYREGRHELSSNERQQLGFRLADRLGHERLYPIDYKQACHLVRDSLGA